MIDFDEALALVTQRVEPLGSEDVPLALAARRVLAEPVVARSDAPRTALAAMDGYAVKDCSTATGTWLTVIGESRAGAGFPGAVQPGEATRIFTGAPMPQGTDRCIMQEYASREGDQVCFAPGYGPGRHVRAARSDFSAGDCLLDAGTRLSARAMVAAAAADRATLKVRARPRVAIIATGDELAPPGEAHSRSRAIPDSVSHGVSAMAESAGAQVAMRNVGADNLPALERVAADLLERADLVIVTGGASVGERDFAKPMFAAHGLDLLFSKVAIKPGRPVWLGTARGKWVLGLPGNPTSAMVTARLMLVPLLAALQGEAIDAVMRWRHLSLAQPLPATGSRETFFRASWEEGGLNPIGNQQSGIQAALVQADWLIRSAPGSPARTAGETVTALAF